MRPSVRKLAYTEIADRLRTAILSGELPSGYRLPTEAVLGERFGVGRSTIREALRLLTSQGLITTSRGLGGGSSVAQLNHGDVARMLGVGIQMLAQSEGCSIPEMFEARELLEITAARLAALRRSPAHLELLRKAVPVDFETMPNRELFLLNKAFHYGVLDATGNRLLHVLAEPVFGIVEGWYQPADMASSFWDAVMSDHRNILKAIHSRDADAAGEQMRRHLGNLEIFLQSQRASQPKPTAPLVNLFGYLPTAGLEADSEKY